MQRTKFPNQKKDIFHSFRGFNSDNKIMFSFVVHQEIDKLVIKTASNNVLYNNYSLDTNNKINKEPRSSKKEQKEIEFLPLSMLLYKTISSYRNITYSRNQIRSWAKEIRILNEVNKVDYDRIEKVLEWYSKNIGGKYIPIILSGYSLRTKFFRLEDAIERNTTSKSDKYEYFDGVKYIKGDDGRYYHARTGTLYIP